MNIIFLLIFAISIFFPAVPFLLACAFGLFWLFSVTCEEGEKIFLKNVFIWAVSIRFIAAFLYTALAIHSTGRVDFFGDSSYYDYAAFLLSKIPWSQLNKEAVITTFGSGVITLPVYVVSYLYSLFGYSPFAAKLINCLFGIGTAFLIYAIAKELFGKRAARFSLLLALYWPSFFLWSLTNLREVSIAFLLSGIFYCYINFLKRKKRLLNFCCIILGLYSLGLYMGLAMFSKLILGILLSGMIFLLPRRKLTRIILVLVIIYTGSLFIKNRNVSFQNIKNLAIGYMQTAIVRIQVADQRRAGSVYKIYEDKYYGDQSLIYSMTNFEFIKYVAFSAMHFMFEPLPWNIKSKIALLAFPQMLIVYLALPFGILGLFLGLRYRRGITIILTIYLAVITVGTSLVDVYIGGALRHRDILVPMCLIFVSAGLVKAFYGRLDNDK